MSDADDHDDRRAAKSHAEPAQAPPAADGADARRRSSHARLSLSAPASRSSRRPDGRRCAGSTSSARAPAERAWLEEHFDFHPLDYEDVFSRNQRPKVDEYDDYLFIVLHFPRYDKPVGRLNAAELDVFVGPDYVITLPNEPLQPLEYLFERCRTREDLREQLFAKGAGLPALQDRRRLRRRLVPDAAQDGQQARAPRGRHLRGRARARSCATSPTSSRRSSTSAASCARSARRCSDLERTTKRYIPEDLDDLLRRHQRRVRAHLGHARELQGGRRGARGHERVGALPPPQRHPAAS